MPKGKLLALLAIFAAIGVVTATGAFTTVQAERTATVDITGDSSALLQIDGADGPAGDIVDQPSSGVAQIDLTQAIGDGGSIAEGLNAEATTALSPLVTLTNNGNEDVAIDVSVEGVSGSDLSANDVTIIDGDGGDWSSYRNTGSGDSRTFGLRINTEGVNLDDDSSFEITINIDASSEELS